MHQRQSRLAKGVCQTLVVLGTTHCGQSQARSLELGSGGSGSGNDEGAGAAAGASGGALAAPDSCEHAELLRLHRQGDSWVGEVVDELFGADSGVDPGAGNCLHAGAGPDRYYVVDATALPGRATLHAVVDAKFDSLLTLERGFCGDPMTLTCDRGSELGRVYSQLELVVEPGVYRLHVSGASEGEAGDYRLAAALILDDPSCALAPSNEQCAFAEPLDASAPLQTVFMDARCVTGAALYYELDLRDEHGPTGVHIETHNPESAALDAEHPRVVIYGDDPALELSNYSSGEVDKCGVVVGRSRARHVTGTHTSARLEPGRYAIRVKADEPWYGSARIELMRGSDCSPEYDSCSEAKRLKLSSNHARITESTLCNTDTYDWPMHDEDGWAPDRFYRLDLSDQPGPMWLRARILLDDLQFYPALGLLNAQTQGCGALLFASHGTRGAAITGLLPPAEYLLVVDGAYSEGNFGRFTLDVHLSSDGATPVTSCFDEHIEACSASNDVFWRCLERPTLPWCGVTAVSCGLEPEVQSCVCDSEPACCSGEASVADCVDVFCSCRYYCPDYADAPIVCGDQP